MAEVLLVEKERKSPFGRVVAITYAAFHLVMLLALLSQISIEEQAIISSLDTELQQTSHVAIVAIVVAWALGAILLGILMVRLRPKPALRHCTPVQRETEPGTRAG